MNSCPDVCASRSPHNAYSIIFLLFQTEADESEESVYTVDMLAAKSPQGDKDWAHKAIDRAHGESCFDSKKYRKDAVVK